MAGVKWCSEQMDRYMSAIAEELIIGKAVEYNAQGHLKIEPFNHGHTLTILQASLKRAELKEEDIPEAVALRKRTTAPGLVDSIYYYVVWKDPFLAEIRKRIKVIVRERNLEIRVYLTEAQKKRIECEKKTKDFRKTLSPAQIKQFDEIMKLSKY